MKKFQTILAICIIGLSFQSAHAVRIMLCEDENGERSYMRICPPGSYSVTEQRYYVEKKPEPVIPVVTMYFVPDCQWCREIRSYFSDHNIPINEKDLTDNPEMQQELLDTAGELIVPTVKMNDAIFKGYFPNDMDEELEKSGYSPKEE